MDRGASAPHGYRGHRQVVRNGHLPEREITTGIGPVKIRQPRVRDRRLGEEQEAFSSKILPPYLRKTKSIEELLPWLYLNPIESVFATVRLRHRRTKGNGTRARCLAMVHQLMFSASKRWRLLNGSQLLPDVIAGVQFIDGVKSQQDAA